jgi:hypothetical protein
MLALRCVLHYAQDYIVAAWASLAGRLRRMWRLVTIIGHLPLPRRRRRQCGQNGSHGSFRRL